LFLKEGDILIARSGTYVGLCAAVGTGLENFVYGSYMIRLRLSDMSEFNAKFLAIYLNSRFGQMQFDRLKTGSLQFNINIRQIRDIIIPKIPLPEQERIVKEFEVTHAELKNTRQIVKIKEIELAEGLATNITSAAGIRGKLPLPDIEHP
jgi:restriction endonuclease S subunit